MSAPTLIGISQRLVPPGKKLVTLKQHGTPSTDGHCQSGFAIYTPSLLQFRCFQLFLPQYRFQAHCLRFHHPQHLFCLHPLHLNGLFLIHCLRQRCLGNPVAHLLQRSLDRQRFHHSRFHRRFPDRRSTHQPLLHPERQRPIRAHLSRSPNPDFGFLLPPVRWHKRPCFGKYLQQS